MSSYASLRKPRFISVLDIGSSKVVCIIAKLLPFSDSSLVTSRSHAIEIVGFGMQAAKGIKSGIIIDMAQAEHAIRVAVDKAERMAGLMVESVIVNFSAGRIKSHHAEHVLELHGAEVHDSHIQRLFSGLANTSQNGERLVMHLLPLSYSLDAHKGLDTPLGMFGNRLGVRAHLVTADAVTLQNIEACVNQAHLSVEAMVAAPFASGLSCLLDNEMQIGAACIDFGAGATSFSIFSEGRMVYMDCIPIGSNHITLDISRSFYISLEDAERLKSLYGATLAVSSNEGEKITVQPLVQDEPPRSYSRRLLNRIIKARVEEILEIIHERLKRSGYYHGIGKRIVLVGGGAQLLGFSEVATHIFGKEVRFGRPLGVSQLPGLANRGAFCSTVGLLIYPQFMQLKGGLSWAAFGQPLYRSSGRFARMGRWLRESF